MKRRDFTKRAEAAGLKLPSYRNRKVASLIQRELARLLSEEVKDPRLAGAGVLSVDLVKDLSYAEVMLTPPFMPPSPDAEEKFSKKAFKEACETARGFLRRKLGPVLGLRRAPELVFSLSGWKGDPPLPDPEGMLKEPE